MIIDKTQNHGDNDGSGVDNSSFIKMASRQLSGKEGDMEGNPSFLCCFQADVKAEHFTTQWSCLYNGDFFPLLHYLTVYLQFVLLSYLSFVEFCHFSALI